MPTSPLEQTRKRAERLAPFTPSTIIGLTYALDARQRAAIIAALRHCQGMGHPLPLTEAEIDALCKRLGDTQ